MATITDVHDDSPFHAGEQQVQQRLGVREQMERFGRRVIRDHLPEQHREFYAQLPFVSVGHVDAAGRPWASIVAARPGFISTPDARSMRLAAQPVAGDPLAESLAPGLPLGILGMDPTSRRRNRLTGRVTSWDASGAILEVDQTFGNCPQYIRTREIEFVRDPAEPYAGPSAEPLVAIDAEARAMIEAADTFFVASSSGGGDHGRAGGADASHRGGRPGFIGIDDEGTLIIPDYSGNNHFNTLGNFLLDPRAGLLFVDFERGDLLMLTGTVEIVWDGPRLDAYRGAERLWKFRLEHGLRLRDRLPVRWSSGETSPNNALTGTWAETEATLAAEATRNAWRPYRVVHVVDESDEIRSFHLEPNDGGGLPTYVAGQHLPIRIRPHDGSDPVLRTYTLSSAPGDRHYRISVKREVGGLVSGHLHERILVGDVIDAKAPRGAFTFDASETRPAVLLSGGVGVTPMISMLRHAVLEGVRTRYTRPVTFIHAARTIGSRGFFDEARRLVETTAGEVRVVSVLSQPDHRDAEPRDFDFAGRVTPELLSQLLALRDYDFYLCGPSAFMQAMYDSLRELGVRDARIFAEAFGPSALVRRPDAGASPDPELAAPAVEALIEFAGSKFEMPWSSRDGTLLEHAESHGLAPEFSCRGGSCGSCAVRVCSGDVTYESRPTAPIPAGHALLCSAVPAARNGAPSRVVLDL